MRRILVVALVGVAFLTGLPAAATVDDALYADEVTIVGAGGPMEFNGRRYGGTFSVRVVGDRVVLTERVDPDAYMRGIREVPASWEPAALRAQAIAARTYLAWRLDRGRSTSGQRYGYDICATAACQVYRGGVGEPGAAEWDAAVAATAGEILLHDGAPAQAMYSSTTSGRTRNFEDVFGGTPKPYLVSVPSPNEPSPYVRWTIDVTQAEMRAILREAGISAELLNLRVETTADGNGPWIVEGVFTDGLRSWTSWQFRSLMNRHADDALPDDFPALRPDGRRYPTTILGPTYTVVRGLRYDAAVATGPPLVGVYSFVGGGWGHDVGMSQFGAQAMALEGSSHEEILAHYYSDLVPSQAGRFLPSQLVVGLSFTSDPVEVGGTLAVSIDGAPIADGVEGSWRFESTGAQVRIIPPVAFGVAPSLSEAATEVTSTAPLVVVAKPEGGGQVRLVVFEGGTPVFRTAWENWFGGTIVFAPPGLRGGEGVRVAVERREEVDGPTTVVPVTPGFIRWG